MTKRSEMKVNLSKIPVTNQLCVTRDYMKYIKARGFERERNSISTYRFTNSDAV